jgi:hypothetical protein
MTRLGYLGLVVALLLGCRSGPTEQLHEGTPAQLHKGTPVKLLEVKRVPELRQESRGGQVQVFSPKQPGFDLAVARVEFGPATKDETWLTFESQDLELTDTEGRAYRAELKILVALGDPGHTETMELPFALPLAAKPSRLRVGEAVFRLDSR